MKYVHGILGIRTVLLFVFLSAFGCDMKKGGSGWIPEVSVFLKEEGSLVNQEKAVYKTPLLPVDVTSLEILLDVPSGGADLSVGIEEPPSDYFSNDPGPGIRKILLTPDSREPLQGGVWYMEVSCPFAQEAHFILTVQRGSHSNGTYLLSHTGTLAPYEDEDFTLDVPEKAGVLEVDLETQKGDVDLFIGLTLGDEYYGAANPGIGHDIVVITPQSYIPLAAGTWYLHIEGWEEENQYRLTALYR